MGTGTEYSRVAPRKRNMGRCIRNGLMLTSLQPEKYCPFRQFFSVLVRGTFRAPGLYLSQLTSWLGRFIMPVADDPTRDREAREQLERLCDDPSFMAYRNSLESKSAAIVFSGGGGKGAYEAGAMLALYDCGLFGIGSFERLCAVAGTSVG